MTNQATPQQTPPPAEKKRDPRPALKMISLALRCLEAGKKDLAVIVLAELNIRYGGGDIIQLLFDLRQRGMRPRGL